MPRANRTGGLLNVARSLRKFACSWSHIVNWRDRRASNRSLIDPIRSENWTSRAPCTGEPRHDATRRRDGCVSETGETSRGFWWFLNVSTSGLGLKGPPRTSFECSSRWQSGTLLVARIIGFRVVQPVRLHPPGTALLFFSKWRPRSTIIDW